VTVRAGGGGAAPGSRSSLHARSVGRRVPPQAAGARGSCGGRRSRRPRRRRPQRIFPRTRRGEGMPPRRPPQVRARLRLAGGRCS